MFIKLLCKGAAQDDFFLDYKEQKNKTRNLQSN